jgi:hypothetical protein
MVAPSPRCAPPPRRRKGELSGPNRVIAGRDRTPISYDQRAIYFTDRILDAEVASFRPLEGPYDVDHLRGNRRRSPQT